MGEIKLDGYLCERCEHTWIPRIFTVEKPTVCPKCKSPYWNSPRKIKRVAKAVEKEFESEILPFSKKKEKKGFFDDE